MLRRLDYGSADFQQQLQQLLAFDPGFDQQIELRVREILAAVAERGDAAVLEFTAQFDQLSVPSLEELEVQPAARLAALQSLPDEQRQALEFARQSLQTYAERQALTAWQFTDAYGNQLGQQVTALDRVGIYVPGGLAAYPSSVLMNAVPAKVAGVAEIIMVVPAPKGVINPLVLAAAELAGVDRVFTIGGAQAVAALAYGTETIPAVDKIVGPGNAYVAEAKRRVFGRVGIDMVAGPSEVLIIADASADPDVVALDMFAQAEHDANAQAIVISADAQLLDAVAASVARLLAEMPRREIIAESLRGRGALIQVSNLQQAAELANVIAAEHLELALANPDVILPLIRHAGAIFIGHHSAEALGDYCAGPNHVLPTSRSARFFSPLGVYDFQKRSSLVRCTSAGAAVLAQHAQVLAQGEGLFAHAAAAAKRLK